MASGRLSTAGGGGRRPGVGSFTSSGSERRAAKKRKSISCFWCSSWSRKDCVNADSSQKPTPCPPGLPRQRGTALYYFDQISRLDAFLSYLLRLDADGEHNKNAPHQSALMWGKKRIAPIITAAIAANNTAPAAQSFALAIKG